MGLMSVGNRFSLRSAYAQLGCLFMLGAFGAGCTAGEEPKTAEAAEPAITVAQSSSPHSADKHGKDYNPHAAANASSTSARFVEGKHYTVLKGVPKYEAGDKIQVAEFFSYGCPHCFKMERVLKKWHEEKPGSITFERIPAYWNPSLDG